MHTKSTNSKKLAWEFVSIDPNTEKGSYGRTITESKWQSSIEMDDKPIKKTRPNSSPNFKTKEYKIQNKRVHERTISMPEETQAVDINIQSPKINAPFSRNITAPIPHCNPQININQNNQYTVENNVPYYYQTNNPQIRMTSHQYSNNYMSSSVIGSKTSNTSYICPVSSTDPNVQRQIIEEMNRKHFQ